MLRDFIAARAPPQRHVTCERQCVREGFLGPRLGYVTPFRGRAAAWTHLCAVSHLDVVEANTCQCIMFVVAFLASDQQATSWHARTATSAKRFVSDSVSFGIIGVRFVQHRALPTPPAAPHVRPPRPQLPRAASLKARPWPLCQSGSCASRPRALLRRLRFIGQADGWWSRVDALDPCRGVALLSLSHRNGAPVVFQSITPCLLSNISIIKQAKPSLFGVTVRAAPGSSPTLTMQS